jgi:outer membrane receptor protein involved in Fe transport
MRIPDSGAKHGATALAVALCGITAGGTASGADEKIGNIDVIATTPLDGLGIPRDRVPANVQSASSLDLERQKPQTLADFMDDNMSGVYVNEAQSNPFQPDLSFRGFTASPLLGNPIGLSVYVDGVRVNESFGDTVFWDLIPTAAVERIDLIPGSNPVFGLNTLGGALAVRTRSGRDLNGFGADLSGGSFGRRSAELELGGASGAFDGFLAAHYYQEDGWRDHSPSEVRQLFGKTGWQAGANNFALFYTHASNQLIGNGLAPESLLETRRDSVYTFPDETSPDLDFVNLTASHAFGESTLLTANAYWRSLRVPTFNGDAEFDDGGTPTDILDDTYAAENHRTATAQRTTGAAVQVAFAGTLAGNENQVTLGVSYDRGRTEFEQFDQDAELTDDRGTEATGDFVLATGVLGHNRYRGFYLTDTLALGAKAHVTLSGRYNHAEVEIRDTTGEAPELEGDHSFHRFNPAIGFTYSFNATVVAYAGYNEGFRAPSPVELTCADESAPCSLPVGFVADPPLEPVVAKSWETGLRGAVGATRWTAAAYTTDLHDDILFTALGASQGFFANVPKTRRRGLELNVAGRIGALDWNANYARVSATFESDVALFNPVASPADPSQPATIDVTAGDRLPGIPEDLAKLSLDYALPRGFSLGGTVTAVSGQFLRGDENNQLDKLPGYGVLNLRGTWQASSALRLYVKVDNALDREFATLGALNRNAFDANDQPLTGVGPGPVERFVSPGAPRSFWAGFEYRFARSPAAQPPDAD